MNVLNIICGIFLPTVLFLTGAVFFIRLARYIFSFRFFISKLTKKVPHAKSSFSSLFLALGGTLGVGNICGVCAAIYVGGAGCVFWIWVCALLSAATKYAEVVLAVKYRQKQPDGTSVGGAPYYIKNGLGMKKTAALFAVLCIVTAFTMGNATQIKTASDFAVITLGLPRIVSAAFFSVVILALTQGKAKRIRNFTAGAVPLLCIAYTVLCIINIVAFRQGIAPLTRQILSEAFSFRAGAGGLAAIFTSPALRLGITRGVMSNEAGCGTAPIAYASDVNASSVKCGLLGITEVAVDTLVLCTLTAYAILLPNTNLSENTAKSILSAFSSVIGKIASPIITFSVMIFALASACAWGFYAISSAKFLKIEANFSSFFPYAYSAVAFISCYAEEGIIWSISDLCIAVMAIINTCAILTMMREVSAETLSDNVSDIPLTHKKL